MTHDPEHRRRAIWPAVTCLCPTYGRFERLRDAVACFLLQDYPGDRRLCVVSDEPEPISLRDVPDESWMMTLKWRMSLSWANRRYPTLGHKRQALLEAAQTPLVAHWDDDDLYLPWHLSGLVEALRSTPGATCVKPRNAWWGVGPRGGFDLRGPCHNVFEGQMVFDRLRALELGGYPPLHTGQAKALLRAFHDAGELLKTDPAPADISYVYRWGDGVDHASARKDLTRDTDFGAGRPLIPDGDPTEWARKRLADQFDNVAEGVKARVHNPDWDEGGHRVSGQDAQSVQERLTRAIRPERAEGPT